MSRALAVCWVVLVLASAGGCGVAAPRGDVREVPETGPGGRRQPLGLSPRQELAIGRRAYDQVVTEFRDRILPGTAPEVRRVRAVTARLQRAAEIEPLQREI